MGINEKISVMVNGLPGKMASAIAEKLLLSPEFSLVPFSLTAEETSERTYKIPMAEFVLVKPSERYEMFPKIQTFQEHRPFISVDYTHPSAVNENVEFYSEYDNGLPFVMGTTGGDRNALEEIVIDSEICAVIAPNMAAPIVSLMNFMDKYSKEHEGDLRDCGLSIIESHQKGKADTSGTAKAMVQYFNLLGINFDVKDIIMIRGPDEQRKLGVPQEHLGGHGWHTYVLKANSKKNYDDISNLDAAIFREVLTHSNPALKGYNHFDGLVNEFSTRAVSPDKSVLLAINLTEENNFTIAHNINGRSVYVDGTLEAIRFLNTKIQAGEKGKVYSMADVLKH
jgi:4-hydroxy-tetrahydrodipicolinate reductase